MCSSLVRSSRQFISVGPSMISTIMQNMTSVAAAAAEEKAKAADSDNVEGLFNFAPHGETIMGQQGWPCVEGAGLGGVVMAVLFI